MRRRNEGTKTSFDEILQTKCFLIYIDLLENLAKIMLTISKEKFSFILRAAAKSSLISVTEAWRCSRGWVERPTIYDPQGQASVAGHNCSISARTSDPARSLLREVTSNHHLWTAAKCQPHSRGEMHFSHTKAGNDYLWFMTTPPKQMLVPPPETSFILWNTNKAPIVERCQQRMKNGGCRRRAESFVQIQWCFLKLDDRIVQINS